MDIVIKYVNPAEAQGVAHGHEALDEKLVFQ